MGIDHLQDLLMERLRHTNTFVSSEVQHGTTLVVRDLNPLMHLRDFSTMDAPIGFNLRDQDAERKLYLYTDAKEQAEKAGKVLPVDFFHYVTLRVPAGTKKLVLVSDNGTVPLPAKDLERCERKACVYDLVEAYTSAEVKEFTEFGYIRENGEIVSDGIDMRRLVGSKIKHKFFQWLVTSAPLLFRRKGFELVLMLEGTSHCSVRVTETVVMVCPLSNKIKAEFPESDVFIPEIIERELKEEKEIDDGKYKVLVQSIDSDMIPILTTRFYDWMREKKLLLSLEVRAGVLLLNDLVNELAMKSVPPRVFMGTCILLGTDFVRKRWLTNRLSPSSIFESVFAMGKILGNDWDYTSPNGLEKLMCMAITYHYNGVNRGCMSTFREARELYQDRHKKAVPEYLLMTVDRLMAPVVEKVEFKHKPVKRLVEGETREANVREVVQYDCYPFEQFRFNMNYWLRGDCHTYNRGILPRV